MAGRTGAVPTSRQGEGTLKLASLGEPIPGTANLYHWGDGCVLKLHGPDALPEDVAWLGCVERELYGAGLPVPEVGELIEVEGCLGQVYERIEGPSIAEALFGAAGDEAEGARLSRIFAEVHASIHAHGPVDGFATQQHALAKTIRRAGPLPDDLRQAALVALAAMGPGDRLCHGDYHPYNVILSPRGPVVIDWPNGHIGDPLEDVARSLLMLEGAAMTEPSLTDLTLRFSQEYRDRYFELHPGDQGALAAWRPIVAAARLTDGIAEQVTWLIEQVRAGLSRGV
jgi:hypothetical protein